MRETLRLRYFENNVTSRLSKLTDEMQIILKHESRFALQAQQVNDIEYLTLNLI